MNMLKSKMVVKAACAVSLSVGAVLYASATVYTNALDATQYLTPRTAANWNDATFWGGGGVPNDPDDIVVFTASSWHGGNIFLTSAVGISVNRIDCSYNLPRLCYVSDEPVSFYGSDASGSSVSSKGVWYYAPASIPANTLPNLLKICFCGDFSLPAGSRCLFHGTPDVAFHYDRYTTAPGETREIPAWEGTVRVYDLPLNFYAPESSTNAVVLDFEQQAGSPYLRRISGTSADPLCVGTLVTGAGIPDGTYLKRVFPLKEWIELSNPVTSTAAQNSLTFAPFSPKVHLRVAEYRPNGSDVNNAINVSKYGTTDTMELEIDYIRLLATSAGGAPRSLIFGTAPLDDNVVLAQPFKPARVIIHEVSQDADSNVSLETCDLLFSTTPKVTGPGFPLSIVRQPLATAEARLSVTGTMTAAIGELQDFKGTIIKTGTGTLRVGFTTNQIANAGRLVVEEGTFAIANPGEGCKTADEIVTIGALEVSAGATLRLPARGLCVTGNVSIATDAVIDGPGSLYVLRTIPLVTKDVLQNGATIVYGGEISVIDEPLPDTVPGNPAFWVDISQTNTVEQTPWCGAIGVTRINDCRKMSADDAYLFSTNVSDGTYLPTLKEDPRTGWSVFFYGQFESYSNALPLPPIRPDLSDTHAWSQPVKGIRAVFQVYSMMGRGGPTAANVTYGGNFLGTTGETTVRRPDGGVVGTTSIWNRYRYTWERNFSDGLFTWVCPGLGDPVRTGTIHMNGVVPTDTGTTYPYASYYASAGITNYQPVVVSVILNSDAPAYPEANSYDYNYRYGNQQTSGNKFLSELIVYTNAVTELDRLQITAYLMKKWKNCDIAYLPIQSDAAPLPSLDLAQVDTINVAAGSARIVDTLTGAGTLTKQGSGTLKVASVLNVGASLEVAGGTLDITSVRATATDLPADRHSHFDASDLSTFTYTVDGDVTNITQWADVRGASTQTANHRADSTNWPTLRASAKLGGKTYVDFGEARWWPKGAVDWTAVPCLGFTHANNNQHTVIAVWGSEHGGGNLAGGPGTAHYIDSAWTLTRGGNLKQPLGADKDAYIVRARGAQLYNLRFPSAVRFRKNGVSCDPNATGLSGDFDIVSLVSDDSFGVGGFSGVYNLDEYAGGEQFAEYMIYNRGLAAPDIDYIEAYLRKKWFGVPTPGYDGASFANVNVSSGATLRVTGNAPLAVNKLTLAGGTVDGAIALATGAEIVVNVASDGSTSTQTGTGWDFSLGGTVSFAGDVGKLTLGEHVLFSGVAGFPLDKWTVAPWTHQPTYTVTLRMKGDDLVFNVTRPGLSIIIR
jgi:hypothetical protein